MTQPTARAGRRRTARCTIETFRLKDPDLTLKDLYARERKTPSTRRVSRHTLNDHDFALHGMQRLKYFDVRAEQRDGEIRGYTLLYDQAMNGIVAPVVNAMAAAFAPFPARAMPFAVLARPVEYGTGLIVGARGDIVTDRQVTDGCKVIVAAGLGSAERVAEDKAQGLALLRVYGQRDLPALPLPRDVANTKESRMSLTLIGIPDPHDQQGAHSPKEFKARLASGGAIDLRQPVPMAGLSGGAVLDDAGHVLGMMQTRNAVLASNGPPLAPVHLVTTATIRDFLQAHDVTPATTGNARDALVRVICVRRRSRTAPPAEDDPLGVNRLICSSNPAYASPRRPSCLPSDPASRTAHGRRGVRTARLRRGSIRRRG